MKGITRKIHMLCLVLVNSVLLNLLCEWIFSVGGSTTLSELFPLQNLKLVDFTERHVEIGVHEQDCVVTTMPPPMTSYQYHRPSTSSSPLYCLLAEWIIRLVECCFTSTETVGLLLTGAQDGHLDFHTAPEL